MVNILFVCKWNRFRSKIAEAIFNKLNNNLNNKAKSGGIIPGLSISKEIFEACKKAGFPISKKTQGISYNLLMWSDIIIIVANDVPKEIFKEIERNDNKKVVVWQIEDTTNDDVREEIITAIKNKIEDLLGELKK